MSNENAVPDHGGSVGKDEFDFLKGEHSAIAEIVSMESVVNLLINKGICTPEELWEQEKIRKKQFDDLRTAPIVSTARPSMSRANGTHGSHVGLRHWLKRKMSKRKFTRQLGTKVFGWQWRRVKVPLEGKKAE